MKMRLINNKGSAFNGKALDDEAVKCALINNKGSAKHGKQLE